MENTSENMENTSENMENTSENMENTSENMENTSEGIEDTSESMENTPDISEQLKIASARLAEYVKDFELSLDSISAVYQVIKNDWGEEEDKKYDEGICDIEYRFPKILDYVKKTSAELEEMSEKYRKEE